ncbi:hypothetical protein [Liberibacter crescens]|uniref:hypothetical protein n=1 Tax=Liberibacter crescens TaxID=1273132 RepID=UPI0002EE4EEB|nr:hypothetical protein [Liberibacter crescens]AMC12641.1 hypothetical protein RL73_02515 [Liberibacter crescens]
MSETSLDNRVTHLEEGFKGLNNRFDRLEGKIDSEFKENRNKLETITEKINAQGISLAELKGKIGGVHITIVSTGIILGIIYTVFQLVHLIPVTH